MSAIVARRPSDPGRHPWSAHKHGHVLARVVAAGPGRVTAVIGAQDSNVARSEPREQGRHARVEILERGGIAFHVPAMAIEHVEVDEVAEHDRAVRRGGQCLERRVEQRRVAGRLDRAAYAAVREDVGDLADADHLATARDQLVEHGRRGRWHGIVAAVAGTDEIARNRADERPRDDAADPVFVDQLARDQAQVEQPRRGRRPPRGPRSGTRCRPRCRRWACPCARALRPAAR